MSPHTRRRRTQSATRRRRIGGGGQPDPLPATDEPSTAQVLINIPLQFLQNGIRGLARHVGVDPNAKTEDITKQLRAQLTTIADVVHDPVVQRELKRSVNQGTRLVVSAVDVAGPNFVNAGANMVKAVPVAGNVVSIMSAGEHAAMAGANAAQKAAELGIVSMNIVNKIKTAAKASSSLSQSTQSLANSIHSTTTQAVKSGTQYAKSTLGVDNN